MEIQPGAWCSGQFAPPSQHSEILLRPTPRRILINSIGRPDAFATAGGVLLLKVLQMENY
jgi:hypothetical protein